MLMESNGVQPGQTVAPGSGSPPSAPDQPPAPATPEQPAPTPSPEPTAPNPEPAPQGPTPEQPSNEESKFYNPQSDTEQSEDPEAVQPITWTASEFIDHAKSSGWYMALAVGAVIGAVFIYLLTKDPISAIVIIVAAVLLGMYAGHKPREMQYKLDFRGLTIGEKHYGYDEFRSFSVLPEGAFSSIVFMPLKRFALTTTIYYAPDDEEKIVTLLSDYLPLEDRGHDAVDRLMHRIHF